MTAPDVSMFDGYEWADLGDLCPHGCPHKGRSYVGSGPGLAREHLVECDSCGCRGWLDARAGREWSDHEWWAGRIEFRVASPA